MTLDFDISDPYDPNFLGFGQNLLKISALRAKFREQFALQLQFMTQAL